MFEGLMNIIISANGVLWGWLLSILLIGGGVFLTFYLGFPFIRHFNRLFKSMLLKGPIDDGVSAFSTVAAVVGGQVGTGNLAGVATALASGGPGAVFWMWVTALVGMSSIFTETVLGIKYREVNPKDGTYKGGPAYYMTKGLNAKWLGVFSSIALLIGIGTTTPMVHANAITSAIGGVSSINPLYIGIGLAIFAALVVFGGIKSLTNFASKIVPFMAIAYIIVALIVVVGNITRIPEVFSMIFKGAFGVRQVAGGALGFSIQQAFRYGTARGLFSNEAGQGSTPNISSSANVYHPATQGFSAMAAVVIDTLMICTATALIILLSGTLDSGATGVKLTQLALATQFGEGGKWIIFFAILLFASTSLVACLYMGEVNVRFIVSNEKYQNKAVRIYQLLALTLIVIGSVVTSEYIWQMSDFASALMTIPNVITILILSREAKEILTDYETQLKQGIKMPDYWNNKNATYVVQGSERNINK